MWQVITSAHWICEALNRPNCLMLAVVFTPSFGNTQVGSQMILGQDLGIKLNCLYFWSAIWSSLELCTGLWSFHLQERGRKELQNIWGGGVAAPFTSVSCGVRDLWEHTLWNLKRKLEQCSYWQYIWPWTDTMRRDWLAQWCIFHVERRWMLNWCCIFISSVHPEIKTIGNH